MPSKDNRQFIVAPNGDTRMGKAPEKTAKKLYSDTMFTISKLSERSKRAVREAVELQNDRHETEQMHAYGTPIAGEAAAREALNEKVLAKLKKAEDETKLVLEAYAKLDQDLNDLGIPADAPTRLEVAKKRELGAPLLEKITMQIQHESDKYSNAHRYNSVREALRPEEPPVTRKAPKEPGRPMTETLERPVLGSEFTAGEAADFHRKFSEAAAKDEKGVISPEEVARRIALADAEDALQQELEDGRKRLAEVAPGYTKAEEEARKNRPTSRKLGPTPSGDKLFNAARTTEKYEGDNVDEDSEQDTAAELAKAKARLAEVAPKYTPAEEAAQKNKTVTNKLRPTVTGNTLYHAPSDVGELPGKFSPATVDEHFAQLGIKPNIHRYEQENAAEAEPPVDFNNLALALEKISERLEINSIRSVEELQAALNSPEITRGLNELIPAKEHGKNILELTGKKTLGLFGKPQFNKAKASEYFLKLTNQAIERAAQIVDNRPNDKKDEDIESKIIPTLSGANAVHVAQSKKEYQPAKPDKKTEATDAAWEEMTAESKAKTESAFETAKNREIVSEYVNNMTPVFIKRRSGEMNSGGIVRFLTPNDLALVNWNDPQTKEPSHKYVKISDLIAWQKEGAQAPQTKNYEKPKNMYEGASARLNALQEQLSSGHISTLQQFEAVLNQMSDPSYKDLLSPQERYTTNVAETVSTKTKGFLKTKYTFDAKLAAEFLEKLKQNAEKISQTF